MINDAMRGYRGFMETLSPETLPRLGDYVRDDVHFCDAFNDVRGIGAMEAIFRHMFASVGPVTFTITHDAGQDRLYFMEWRFTGRFRGRDWEFPGATRVTFDDAGRVAEHIDYWDSGQHFYEHLPLVGGLPARLRRFLAAQAQKHG